MNYLVKILINALITYGLATWVLSGVYIDNFITAIIFALVLSIFNALIKPILVFFTIPITIISLGVFLLIINALMVYWSSELIGGISIDNFWWAIGFSILLSISSSFLNSALDKND